MSSGLASATGMFCVVSKAGLVGKVGFEGGGEGGALGRAAEILPPAARACLTGGRVAGGLPFRCATGRMALSCLTIYAAEQTRSLQLRASKCESKEIAKAPRRLRRTPLPLHSKLSCVSHPGLDIVAPAPAASMFLPLRGASTCKDEDKNW